MLGVIIIKIKAGVVFTLNMGWIRQYRLGSCVLLAVWSGDLNAGSSEPDPTSGRRKPGKLSSETLPPNILQHFYNYAAVFPSPQATVISFFSGLNVKNRRPAQIFRYPWYPDSYNLIISEPVVYSVCVLKSVFGNSTIWYAKDETETFNFYWKHFFNYLI